MRQKLFLKVDLKDPLAAMPRLIIYAVLLSLLCGCESMSTLTKFPSPEPPGAEKAMVVLYRPSLFVGVARGIGIEVDGEKVGNMANNSIMYFYRDPGCCAIESISPPMTELGGAKIELELKRKEIVFLEMSWKTKRPSDFLVVGVSPIFAAIPDIDEPHCIKLDPETGWKLFEEKKLSLTDEERNRTDRS